MPQEAAQATNLIDRDRGLEALVPDVIGPPEDEKVRMRKRLDQSRGGRRRIDI